MSFWYYIEPPSIKKQQGNKLQCVLHQWDGVEKQAQNLHWPTCAVHRCVSCYNIFHQKLDLISMKKEFLDYSDYTQTFTHKTAVLKWLNNASYKM